MTQEVRDGGAQWLHTCQPGATARRCTFFHDGVAYSAWKCDICHFIQGDVIESGAFPPESWWAEQVASGYHVASHAFKVAVIVQAVAQAGGSIDKAAQLLKVERTFIYQTMRRYGMDVKEIRALAAKCAQEPAAARQKLMQETAKRFGVQRVTKGSQRSADLASKKNSASRKKKATSTRKKKTARKKEGS